MRTERGRIVCRCIRLALTSLLAASTIFVSSICVAKNVTAVEKTALFVAIEQQSLDVTLRDLAQSFQIQIVTESDLSKNRQVSAFKGIYTIDEALSVALTPLRLTHRWINQRMITVIEKPALTTFLGELKTERQVWLEKIQVTGVRAALVSALNYKANDTRLIDSIQAEDLGDFPDLNLAESLQRVPGVSLERSLSGMSRTITVRGLSSQFTQIVLNGMAGATGGGGRSGAIDTLTSGAGNDGRHFNFDVLPSELFTSAVIVKSPQAGNIEGGIASLIELSTPSPFDLGDRKGSVSVQGVWGEVTGLRPRLSIVFAKNLTDDIAIMFGSVYSENSSQTSEVGYNRLVPLADRIANAVGFSNTELNALLPEWGQAFVRLRETTLFSNLITAEWRRADAAKIRFDAIYSNSVGSENAVQAIYDLNTIIPSSINISDNVITAATLTDFNRRQLQFQFDGVDDLLQQYTLDGHFSVGSISDVNWKINSFLGYNKREITRPFRQLDYFGQGGNFTYDLSDGFTNFSTTMPILSSDAAGYSFGSSFAADNASASRQLDAALSVSGEYYTNFFQSIRFGVRYSDRESSNGEPFFGLINFAIHPNLSELGILLQKTEIDFSRSANSYPRQIFWVDTVAASLFLQNGQDLMDQDTFNLGQIKLDGALIGSALANATTFSTVAEDTLAGFIDADFTFGELDLNAGIRFVNTRVKASSVALSNDALIPIDTTSGYFKALPTLNAKYNITDKLFFRVSAAKTLSRPSLTDLAPRQTINFDFTANPNTGEVIAQGSVARGNPRLKPFTAKQFDVGLEWHFDNEGILALTYFQKNFSSLISTSRTRNQNTVVPTSTGQQSGQFEVAEPKNEGCGSVDGVEFSFQTSLKNLSRTLASYGFFFNFTKLDSSASLNALNNEVGREQFQPFANLSPSSLNLGIYFDDGDFDMRLNFFWIDGFTKDLLEPKDNGRFQQQYGQLDFTLNYTIFRNLKFQIQATNLLDEALNFSSSQGYVPIAAMNAERRVAFGLLAKF